MSDKPEYPRNCDFMTDHCYPHKMTIEQFFNEIDRGRAPFIGNMKKLNVPDELYVEEWMRKFVDWMEMK